MMGLAQFVMAVQVAGGMNIYCRRNNPECPFCKTAVRSVWARIR